MFKVCHILLISYHKFWYKWSTTGTIFTPLAVRMVCALGPDGKLKDASAIDWYNDPDDDTPFPAPPPPPASASVSCRSGWALKPTEKICEAANTAPAKKLAPAPPPNNAVLDEVEVDGVTTDAATDNKDSPLMYQETKAMGDADCCDARTRAGQEIGYFHICVKEYRTLSVSLSLSILCSASNPHPNPNPLSRALRIRLSALSRASDTSETH